MALEILQKGTSREVTVNNSKTDGAGTVEHHDLSHVTYCSKIITSHHPAETETNACSDFPILWKSQELKTDSI
jgi:hypothetical protein